MRLNFYRENAVWPFVHALTNANLYIATRDWKLSIVLMYVWESFEFAVMTRFMENFSEVMDDSLIGDPIIGITIILALALIDYHTGWNLDFRRIVPAWNRFIQFVVTSVITCIIATTHEEPGAFVLVIGAAYIATVLAFYGYYLFRTMPSREFANIQRETKKSVALWLGIVIILMIVVAPQEVPSSEFPYNTYMRVAFVEGTVFAAAITVIVTNHYISNKVKV